MMLRKTRKPEPKARLSAQDWELAALEALAESGLAAVAVEPLARRLGVTKGSFYWHFPTREALIQAAIERWEKSDEDQVIAPAAAVSDPRERLRELIRQVSRKRQSHAVFAALFRTLDQPLVGPLVERVSARRIAFLTDAFRHAGFDANTAANRARLAFSAYVGFVQLAQIGQPRMTHEEFEDYIRDFIATLIPR
ncbi:MAG: TetR/AcrR family transcriptional regulator [Dokdonella sp.]|uniref:TetR/AcrR family transcriptional regulator n=1 Tax=Dokdonella sp. TaxID=2291710 RepID=UPI0025BF6177|nr:TetR/AcrR family transcriptional regulator [Dokdonella sp.]MBZ0222416.1 TetR/AcrR family transcriptional regulator [Dokdonella sp.]MCC7255018.1 TetR/AcrR family transcriptional regulator [Dokdonella sp.]